MGLDTTVLPMEMTIKWSCSSIDIRYDLSLDFTRSEAKLNFNTSYTNFLFSYHMHYLSYHYNGTLKLHPLPSDQNLSYNVGSGSFDLYSDERVLSIEELCGTS